MSYKVGSASSYGASKGLANYQNNALYWSKSTNLPAHDC